MSKLKVMVLGATGVVGQRLVSLLAEHPWFEITALAASAKSAGATYGESIAGKWHTPHIPSRIADFRLRDCVPGEDVRIVFSALDADVAGPIEEEFAGAGYIVCSNARNHRLRPLVPLLVPEVNPDHSALLKDQKYGEGGIVTNPNCAVSGIALALAPLHRCFGIKRVAVTTMQSLSGAGYPGVPALDLLANIVPYIEGEEDKIERETKKILGTQKKASAIRMSAQCARVGTAVGHLVMAAVEFQRPVSLEDAQAAMTEFRPLAGAGLPSAPAVPLHLSGNPFRPQPVLDANRENGMAVTIGRLRYDSAFGLRFTLLVNNLIRGAAGGAVLNAELLMTRGLLT